ncbi:MAG TPA: family 10 glycosylhydrolase [Chitinophagaceae bacterium]
MSKSFFTLILALATLLSVAQDSSVVEVANPRPEFRGVWIATVDNIDWPLPQQYNAEDQKREFIRQLEMHQRNGMNAVIVQVRPASDAFYPSPYEPWSQWLTGKQGKAPAPYYDPLQFMIEESHKRGFEFHAWLNPYRANVSIGKASIAPNHITKLHPEWFVSYGGKLYFDPGNKEGQKWVTGVVRDIVKRYDVDAIHMDDYFYPYRVPGKEFPDWKTFQQYGIGMTRDEWRRSNTDSIIVALSGAIKEEKPWVKFGISPFGVWRNDDKDPMGSPTQAGVTNYDDLYADILLWTKNGWIDYVVPQLYWEMGHPKVAFETLIDWWSKHSYGRHMYIGHGVYRAYEPKNWPWHRADQLPRQLQLLRTYNTVHGSAYFSSKTFNNNPNGWNDSLQNNYYSQRVPVPDMPWLPQNPNSKIVKAVSPAAPATGGAAHPTSTEAKMD